MIPNTKEPQRHNTNLLRNTAVALIVCMIPSIAAASSWSPTLLVNTEAFQSIDDGDGSTDIELRFGETGRELRWNVTDSQFEFDGSVEVQGTLSGNVVHAQDTLTSSGGLVVEGAATFNSTITLNGVTYTFPFGDASASGRVLSSDGSGNLSWTQAGVDTDTTYSAGEGIDLNGTVFSRNATLTGTSLEVYGTASGRIVHAQDNLTSSGGLQVDGSVRFGALASCPNLTTDANGVISCNNTDYITEAELTSEADLETQIGGANVIVETEIDSESELEAIVGVDFLKGSEIDTESELESFLTDVSNVLTNNDSTTNLSEGTNLYFTNERVDDRINSAFRAGSGITFNYDDANNTFTINTGFSSGAQVSLSPEYAGAVYYGDGSNNVGQMVLAYDSTAKENYYQWNSTASSLQDYTIAVRVKVPDEFTHWDGQAPIQFRYRTNAATSADNQIDVTMLDTAGSAVSLTGGADLANTSWTTATITGPESTGTYTPGSYVTILITMQARTTNTGEAHAGYLNLNWTTKKR